LEVLLPQLAAVQVEGVRAGTELIRISARTRDGVSITCPAAVRPLTGCTAGTYGTSPTKRSAADR
jgi:hypothetical protein